jgi:hypothetical protein
MHWQQWLVEGMVFIIFGFIVTWGGSYLINLIHTPAILHHEQAQVIIGLESDKSLLQAEVDDLRKPKIRPEVEKLARDGWNKLDTQEKKAVKLLLDYGDMTDRDALQRLGLSQLQIFDLIRTKTNFVHRTEAKGPYEHIRGYEGTWKINPQFSGALRQIAKEELP